jgi:hypothetical protein
MHGFPWNLGNLSNGFGNLETRHLLDDFWENLDITRIPGFFTGFCGFLKPLKNKALKASG